MNPSATYRDDLRRARALHDSPTRVTRPPAPAGWQQAFTEDAIAILARYRDVPLTAMFTAATGSVPWPD